MLRFFSEETSGGISIVTFVGMLVISNVPRAKILEEILVQVREKNTGQLLKIFGVLPERNFEKTS